MVKKEQCFTRNNIHKIFLALAICFFAFILSGCVKFETNIDINRNGKARVEDVTMLSNEAINFAEIDVREKIDDINAYNNPNLTAVKVHGSGYTGIKITYEIKDISKADIKDADNVVLAYFESRHLCGKIVYIEKNLFSTNYYIDSIVDYSVNPQTGEKDERLLNFVQSGISIKIPVKAFENNANSIDEKEHIYRWEYNTNEPRNRIILKYKLLNITNIIIAIIILLIILIGSFYLFLYLSKRPKQAVKKEKIASQASICPFCSEKINEGTKECPYCKEILVKKCPYCGEEIKIDAITCEFCGELLNNKGELDD